MINSDLEFFNLESVNTSLKFNHFSIIIYYTGSELKTDSTLGTDFDCVHSVNDGSFIKNANSQVKNTPAGIYSLGNSWTLKWSKRYTKQISVRGRQWASDEKFKASFMLDSDSVCIINPLDESTWSKTNTNEGSQYQHGGFRVSG